MPYRLHIPDRITEGYGPNVAAVRMLAQEGATLLVTVDCGTAGHEPLAEAGRLGMDVVVLDHHGAPEVLPPVRALVNPNRLDDISGLGHLCAAGVVFLTLVALNRRLRRDGLAIPDLMAGLDLVALATIADVVPLHGLNRAFVRQGLAVMRGRGRRGLSALLDAAGLGEAPQAWHLGFLLGPRINAGGRIGDSTLGARLLLCEDPIEAAGIAARLDALNRERQAIEAAAVAEAEAEMGMRLERDPDQPVLVAGSPDWHPGIVGLIAARLKERFGRPAFAFALRQDGTATGSGRSIPGADLGRAVRACVEAGLAAKGGGHAMAAGVTLAALDLDRFREALSGDLAASVPRRASARPCWSTASSRPAACSPIWPMPSSGPAPSARGRRSRSSRSPATASPMHGWSAPATSRRSCAAGTASPSAPSRSGRRNRRSGGCCCPISAATSTPPHPVPRPLRAAPTGSSCACATWRRRTDKAPVSRPSIAA